MPAGRPSSGSVCSPGPAMGWLRTGRPRASHRLMERVEALASGATRSRPWAGAGPRPAALGYGRGGRHHPAECGRWAGAAHYTWYPSGNRPPRRRHRAARWRKDGPRQTAAGRRGHRNCRLPEFCRRFAAPASRCGFCRGRACPRPGVGAGSRMLFNDGYRHAQPLRRSGCILALKLH
jgi:hypothetical protein